MALFVKTVSNYLNGDVRRIVFFLGIKKQMLKMNLVDCLKFLMKSLLLDFLLTSWRESLETNLKDF